MAAAGYYHTRALEDHARRVNDLLSNADIRIQTMERLARSFRQCDCGALVLDQKAEFCGICGRRLSGPVLTACE